MKWLSDSNSPYHHHRKDATPSFPEPRIAKVAGFRWDPGGPWQPCDLPSKSCRLLRGLRRRPSPRQRLWSSGCGRHRSDLPSPRPAWSSHAHHTRDNKAWPSGPEGPSCHPAGVAGLRARTPEKPRRPPPHPPTVLLTRREAAGPAGAVPAASLRGQETAPHSGRAGEPGAWGPQSPRLLGGNLSGAWAAAARTGPGRAA